MQVSNLVVRGYDVSMNHAGIVELVDGNLSNYWYVCSNSKQIKHLKEHGILLDLPKKNKNTYSVWDTDVFSAYRLNKWKDVFASLHENCVVHLAGLEDYALGIKHNAHYLGEVGGMIKLALFNKVQLGMRLLEPHSVKMFATFNGSAEKEEIQDAIKQRFNVDFAHTNLKGKQYGEASGDLADAYAIARCVWTEYQLRTGAINQSSLDEKELRVFNRVTKHYPVNILGREWIIHNHSMLKV